MKLKIFKGGYDSNFCYILYEDKEGIIIDPFIDSNVETFIEKFKLKIKYVINTHLHFDHVSGNDYFISKGAKLIDKDFSFDNVNIKMIRTPGHSPDDKCILVNKWLFTGDTLFVGAIGGTGAYFEGSDSKQQYESLQLLMQLDSDIIIYSGHDYGSSETSTIGKERKTNPFIQCKSYEEFKRLTNG